jgi:hypothetical protein
VGALIFAHPYVHLAEWTTEGPGTSKLFVARMLAVAVRLRTNPFPCSCLHALREFISLSQHSPLLAPL